MTCTPYAKFGCTFEFPTPTLPIHYDTFIGLRWRIRVFTRETFNVKREIERKFSVPTKIGQILAVLGVWGFKKFWFLSQKAHLRVNPHRISHFALISVGGYDLQVGSKKKVRKSQTPIEKTMSPLTQGLNYRSACEEMLSQLTQHKTLENIDGVFSPPEL